MGIFWRLGKMKEIILPAWPACSQREWLNLQCDTLWKPCMCADLSLFLPLAVHGVALLESNTVSGNTLSHKSCECPVGGGCCAEGDLSSSPRWQWPGALWAVCWAHLETPLLGCAPRYFLFISWSTRSCLDIFVSIWWGWACGLQQEVQALSDSLGLALCVQQEMTIYFNGFFHLFAELFCECAVP